MLENLSKSGLHYSIDFSLDIKRLQGPLGLLVHLKSGDQSLVFPTHTFKVESLDGRLNSDEEQARRAKLTTKLPRGSRCS